MCPYLLMSVYGAVRLLIRQLPLNAGAHGLGSTGDDGKATLSRLPRLQTTPIPHSAARHDGSLGVAHPQWSGARLRSRLACS